MHIKRYKSFFLIGLFFLIAQFLYAQKNKNVAEGNIGLGIQGGFLFNTPLKTTHSNDIMATHIKSENLVSCMFGVSFQNAFSKRVKFHSELNYEKMESRVTTHEYTPVKELEHRTSDEYIALPVFLKFSLIKHKSTYFYLDAGIYVSYYFRSYVQNVNTSDQYLSYSYKLKENSICDGALAGLGFDWKLDSKMHLTFEIRDHFLVHEAAEKYAFVYS